MTTQTEAQLEADLIALNFKPKILERKKTIERVSEKIKLFIDTFIEGMGGTV